MLLWYDYSIYDDILEMDVVVVVVVVDVV